METLVFPGGYQDQAGYEAIRWRVEGSRRYKLPSLDFFTTIRGIDLHSTDFDSLEPVDPSAGAGQLPLNEAGELSDCVLSGDLLCSVAVGGRRRPVTIAFSLDLRRPAAPLPDSGHRLRLALVLDGVRCQVTDDWLEGGVPRLERALPPGTADVLRDLPVLALLTGRAWPDRHPLPPRGQGPVPECPVQGRLLVRARH
jgi:hypothetical protein